MQHKTALAKVKSHSRIIGLLEDLSQTQKQDPPLLPEEVYSAIDYVLGEVKSDTP